MAGVSALQLLSVECIDCCASYYAAILGVEVYETYVNEATYPEATGSKTQEEDSSPEAPPSGLRGGAK